MSVDYKVKFTISGEALFALFAKMLPIDDVSIEEIPAHKPAPKPIALPGERKRRPPRLNMGINGIILTAMKGKPMRAQELQPLIVAAGFSANSVNSRLEALRLRGIIQRVGDGTWRVMDAA